MSQIKTVCLSVWCLESSGSTTVSWLAGRETAKLRLKSYDSFDSQTQETYRTGLLASLGESWLCNRLLDSSRRPESARSNSAVLLGGKPNMHLRRGEPRPFGGARAASRPSRALCSRDGAALWRWRNNFELWSCAGKASTDAAATTRHASWTASQPSRHCARGSGTAAAASHPSAAQGQAAGAGDDEHADI